MYIYLWHKVYYELALFMEYYISNFPDSNMGLNFILQTCAKVLFLFTANLMLQRPLVENKMTTVSARKVIQTIVITVMILIKKIVSVVS